MDNQTDNSENGWVENKVAILVPPQDWHPDSGRAFAQFLKRREGHETEASPQWIRLSMAAAILALIGVVVALLPWHTLWKLTPESKGKSLEPETAANPGPPTQHQPPALTSFAATPHGELQASKQEQKLAEKSGSGETPSAIIAPAAELQSNLDARRAHSLGIVAAGQQAPPPAPEQEHVPGENVSPGATAPRPIPPMPEPDYTDAARIAHIQGTVVLGVIVRADGTGKVERVVRSLDPGLDQKAVEAFEKWRFTPGMMDGRPVDVHLQVTINFHLY
jgi:TonB family protein